MLCLSFRNDTKILCMHAISDTTAATPTNTNISLNHIQIKQKVPQFFVTFEIYMTVRHFINTPENR